MPAAVPGAIALGLCEATTTTTALFINAVVYPFVGRLTQKRERKLKGVENCVHTSRELPHQMLSWLEKQFAFIGVNGSGLSE